MPGDARDEPAVGLLGGVDRSLQVVRGLRVAAFGPALAPHVREVAERRRGADPLGERHRAVLVGAGEVVLSRVGGVEGQVGEGHELRFDVARTLGELERAPGDVGGLGQITAEGEHVRRRLVGLAGSGRCLRRLRHGEGLLDQLLGLCQPAPLPAGRCQQSEQVRHQRMRRRGRPALQGAGPAQRRLQQLDQVDPAAQEQLLRFAQCMRENGVDVADPRPGQPLIIKGDRNDTAKIRAAQEACKEFAPPQEGGGPQAGDDLDRQAKLAECLRRHGVDVADPQPGQPLRVEGRRENEAETQRAMQECQREVGAPPPSRIG